MHSYCSVSLHTAPNPRYVVTQSRQAVSCQDPLALAAQLETMLGGCPGCMVPLRLMHTLLTQLSGGWHGACMVYAWSLHGACMDGACNHHVCKPQKRQHATMRPAGTAEHAARIEAADAQLAELAGKAEAAEEEANGCGACQQSACCVACPHLLTAPWCSRRALQLQLALVGPGFPCLAKHRIHKARACLQA